MNEEQTKFITDTVNNLFAWQKDESNNIVGVIITTEQNKYSIIKNLVLPLLGINMDDIDRILAMSVEELIGTAKLARIKYLKKEIEKLEIEIGDRK